MILLFNLNVDKVFFTPFLSGCIIILLDIGESPKRFVAIACVIYVSSGSKSTISYLISVLPLLIGK